MYITITRTDVEEITGLCPTDYELDEIVQKLERDYRAQLYVDSLAVIAAVEIDQEASEVRLKLREIGVDNLDETLFCATFEDIVAVISDELASIPEDAKERIDWEKLLRAAEEAARGGNLYDPIAKVVYSVLYPKEIAQTAI